MLRWSVSNITMTSGRAAASCSFCAANSLAISQSGPSRLTKMRKDRGVRHAEPADDLCHRGELRWSVRFRAAPRATLIAVADRRQSINASTAGSIMCRASRSRHRQRDPAPPPRGPAPRDKTRERRCRAVPPRAWPFRLFADRRPAAAGWPNGARVARLGHPQYRAFPVRPAGDANSARSAGQPRCHELFLARLRRARRHLADDGDHDETTACSGTVALNSDVCRRVSAHHRGRQEARLGVDGRTATTIRL